MYRTNKEASHEERDLVGELKELGLLAECSAIPNVPKFQDCTQLSDARNSERIMLRLSSTSNE